MRKLVFAVFALCCAAPAAAGPIITITYDGQFEAGFDVSTTSPSGYFGAGNDLTGVAARIVWTFDPALATLSNSTPALSSISGSMGNPVGGGTVTINGRSLAIGGNFQSSLSRSTNGSNGSLGINVYDQAPPTFFGESFAYTFFSAFSPAITTSQLDAGFTMTANGTTDRFLGDFRFVFNDYATGELQTVYGRIAPGVGTLTLSAAAAAVPEPASWALLIVGFGALGGAMRRRPERPRGIVAA